jgi:hypothetical protein
MAIRLEQAGLGRWCSAWPGPASTGGGSRRLSHRRAGDQARSGHLRSLEEKEVPFFVVGFPVTGRGSFRLGRSLRLAGAIRLRRGLGLACFVTGAVVGGVVSERCLRAGEDQ